MQNKKNWNIIFLSFFCLLSTIILLYILFKFSAYGIDFTDEGSYLNWISNPFLYKTSLSQFGFIYHPLYNFISGDLSWLRRINYLITFILSNILLHLIYNRLIVGEEVNKIVKFISIAGISLSSLAYLFIQTPNYNSLNLQALIVTCIGIVSIEKSNLNRNLLAYLIISIGVWLSFMAKPSSGVGLGLVIFIYLIIFRKFQWKFIFFSSAIFFLLLIIIGIIIDGSIEFFIKRYFLSLDILKNLSTHNINLIFKIDKLQLPLDIKKSIFAFFLTSIFCIWLGFKKYKLKNFFLNIICFLIFFTIGINLLTNINLHLNFGYYQSYQVFGITYASILTYVIFLIKKKINFNEVNWGYLFLFFILPYVFALGTNNNYWLQSSIASFFWLISGFVFIIPLGIKFKTYQPILLLILISQLIISVHLKERIEKPYRYNESLKLSKTKIIISNTKNKLIVSSEFAKYINDAKDIISKSDFKNGDYIIDLSGQSPGLLYLIGAKSLGVPWNIGGYKGSLNMAKAIFKLVECEKVGNSWILFEKKGPRIISTDLLTSLGINFPHQYKMIGSWKTAIGAGGYKYQRIQELYKPIEKKQIINTCNLLKNKKK